MHQGVLHQGVLPLHRLFKIFIRSQETDHEAKFERESFTGSELGKAISQIEARNTLISKIITSRQIDNQTGSWNEFANKVVKLVIFEFIM